MLASVWSAAEAAPKPRAGTQKWELSITFHDPQRIAIPLPGGEHETTFWYVLYTVTNDTGKDVEFYPTFEIVGDDLRTIEGGADVSPAVYSAIEARHKKTYPFFVDPTRMLGRLLQGEDNARTSAAAFVPPDPAVNHFRLSMGGLSGEIVRVRNVSYDPARAGAEDNPQYFVLRKTLVVSYDIPGDDKTRKVTIPVRTDQEWVMR